MRAGPWDCARARNGRQPLANHTGDPPLAPQSGLSLAVAAPRRLSGLDPANQLELAHASTLRFACGPGRLDGL